LQDRDVVALGLTSKKMLDIAKKELEARDETLTQLLFSYTISRMFNVKLLKEVDLFGVGDIHRHPQCVSTQRDLVNFLAWRGPVILILEEEASGDFNEEFKTSLCDRKKFSFRENIYLTGWDDKGVSEKKFDALHAKQSRIGEILIEMRAIMDKIDLLENEFNTEESEQLTTLMELGGDEFYSFYNTFPPKIGDAFEVIMGWIGEFRKLQREKEELDFLILKDVVQLEPFIPEEDVKMLFDDDYEKIREFRNLYAPSPDDVVADIAHQFPIRTLSMVNTLKKIESMIVQWALHRPKILLFAGCKHLEKLQDGLGENDVRFDLDSLYQELENHKAAILLPAASLATHIMKVQKMLKRVKR
jgi:hypothetical protein